MAFTLDEQAQIRMYLGWQARWSQFDNALERALASVGGGSFPAEENQARVALAELVRLDAAIVVAERRIKASAVGSITLNEGEIEMLRARGRTFVGRLARVMGVDVKGDAFGPDVPRFQASPWGPSAGGNEQMQG